MSSWTKYFSLIAIFICATSYSQCSYGEACQIDEEEDCQQESCCKKDCCAPCHPDLLCAYNSSGIINVKSTWDVYISGSYLYWQAKEKGLEYAYAYPATSSGEVIPLNMDFDYASGFKVTACSKFEHDSWALTVDYARVRFKNSESSTAPTGGYLIPTNMYYSNAEESNHADSSSSEWKTDYDMIDLKVGRPCYVGTALILNPFFGGRGGWINQKITASSFISNLDGQESPQEGVSYSKEKTWLIGPRVGVDSSWLLGYGLKVLGNVATSLNYQYFKTYFKQQNYLNSDFLTINAKDTLGYVTPNFDLALGFSWGTYFSENKWHIEISALYDMLYFWNQNSMRQFSDKILRNITTKPSDLIFHGLTASLRFDF